jgi:hypothetical protein
MRKILLFLMMTMLITISGSAQITVWEATGSVSMKTFPASDARLTVPLQLPLDQQRNDFTGAPDEFYDIFYSNKEGTEVARGENRNSCITIRGQYNGGSAQGFNITKVADGANHYPYVTAFTLGSNGNATSVYNAVDGNQNTFTAMGKAFGPTNVMSITVCKEPVILDVCCPPINEKVAFEQFVFEFQPVQPQTNYRMKFNPTPAFKNSMQSYINYLNSTNNNVNTLGVIFSLFDCGNGQNPNCQPWQTAVKISEFGIAWTTPPVGGQSGNFGSWNNLDLTTQYPNGGTMNPPYPMKVNTWYRIGSWKHLDKFWIKGPCPESDFLVRIIVPSVAMKAEPTIEFADLRGKIIEKRPVKNIKR